MFGEANLGRVSSSINSFTSIHRTGECGFVVDVSHVLVVSGPFLERTLTLFLIPAELLELVASIELTSNMRTDFPTERIVICSVETWTIFLDCLLIECVVDFKVLNKMIAPGEALFASVSLAEVARIFLFVLAERSTMATQRVHA